MTGRRIEDQTDLAQAMLEYCEAQEENGAIVCLDQEKAYDKIRHDFIWKTLERMNFPDHFINTLKALYSNGKTCVVINGVLSSMYNVIRGVRQGDPLSCLIFNLAIESLASMLRKSSLKGFAIPGNAERLITTLFADDTTIYLSSSDSYRTLNNILQTWCKASGARFNIHKTVIIPMGSPDYRHGLIETRRLNPAEDEILPEIKIADDGVPVRILGAYVGNRINPEGVWTPTLEKLDRRLKQWQKCHPTQNGKRLILGMEVGGLTQYLTRVQGMPASVEEQIRKSMSAFFWDEASPTVAVDTLHAPVATGGKGLMDISARNEAIDLMRIKTYLRLTTDRPRWTFLMDRMIGNYANHHPHRVHPTSIHNIFLQGWSIKTRGKNAAPKSLVRLLRTATKYGVSLSPDDLEEDTKGSLPVWHHIGAKERLRAGNNTVWADCQRKNHRIMSTRDMLNYTSTPWPTDHETTNSCTCNECTIARQMGCLNPHKCREAGVKLLASLKAEWVPKPPEAMRENYARNRGEFPRHMQQTKHLEEAFRVFRNTKEPEADALMPDTPAPTQQAQTNTQNVDLECDLESFICGTVNHRHQQSQAAIAGVYYAEEDPRNTTLRCTTEVQTNQSAELTGLMHILLTTPKERNIRVHFPNTSVPNQLLRRLQAGSDQNWLLSKNQRILTALVQEMGSRSGRVILEPEVFEGEHPRISEARALAEREMTAEEVENLQSVTLPTRPVTGAKLITMTQSAFYHGIRKDKGQPGTRRAAQINLDVTRHALHEINGEFPSDEAIWKSTKNKVHSHRHRAFLWRVLHNSYKIGHYWDNIPTMEHRGMCRECEVPETMDHILTSCQVSGQDTVWREAERVWNLRAPPDWHVPTLGTILGSSLATLKDRNGKTLEGASRLYTIIISESAQFIWRTRCKWRITNSSDPNKKEQPATLATAWSRQLNRRLHLEALQTNTYRYGRKALSAALVDKTWRSVLRNSEHVQDDWMKTVGDLVGIG